MLLRIGGNRNLDIAVALLDAGDEFGRCLVAIGMRGVSCSDAARRIAAQRDDVADADLMIAVDDFIDLAARGTHTSQMRGRGQAGLGQDAGDGGMGALAGRSAGAIGHRYEIGRERRQPVDGVPQAALHLLGLGRKELKGNGREFLRCKAVLRGGRRLGHGTTNSTAAVKTSGLATGWQNRPNALIQTAHHGWEIAQFLGITHTVCPIFKKVGKIEAEQYARYSERKMAKLYGLFAPEAQFPLDRPPELFLWAIYKIFLIQTNWPTRRSGPRSAGLAGARLICAARAFVGPASRTRLIP